MLKRHSAKAAPERELERLVGTWGESNGSVLYRAIRTAQQLIQLIDKIVAEKSERQRREAFWLCHSKIARASQGIQGVARQRHDAGSSEICDCQCDKRAHRTTV